MDRIEMGIDAYGVVDDDSIDFTIITGETSWRSISKIVDVLFESGKFKYIFIYLYADPAKVKKELIAGLPLDGFEQTAPNHTWRLKRFRRRPGVKK